ncbi:MAG: DUF6282 family protein [Armatimonadota bacterium]|nr:DUF6282 family protein [Armatimonadota bacterium]MDR7567799.1 DUF6282 family protein [Armatimonadota bacterium]MDR7601866.1 DUF6282 family protein [Armatimonadota bacterium]
MSEEIRQPSERAQAVVRGAYDLHVHTGPDALPRRCNDVEAAQGFLQRGLAGFAIKSHYTSTAARARLVNLLVPGIRAFGALCLNAAVGGMNPVAVEIAAREGARIVWMPTVDAVNEANARAEGRTSERAPYWTRLQEELRRQGIAYEPVRVVDRSGQVLPETREVLRAIARHDLVLATGHLSRDEILAVVEAAKQEGIRRLIITHPDFPTQDLPVEDQRLLAREGALLERCFATANTGKISWKELCARIREVGVEHSLLSSDLGQPTAPPPEDGLALMADRLLEAGFSEEEIRIMAVRNPQRLVDGEP